jgi:hypothetical protein
MVSGIVCERGALFVQRVFLIVLSRDLKHLVIPIIIIFLNHFLTENRQFIIPRLRGLPHGNPFGCCSDHSNFNALDSSLPNPVT